MLSSSLQYACFLVLPFAHLLTRSQGAATQLGGTDRPPYEAFAPHIEYNSLDELIGALPYQAEVSLIAPFRDATQAETVAKSST